MDELWLRFNLRFNSLPILSHPLLFVHFELDNVISSGFQKCVSKIQYGGMQDCGDLWG